MSCLEVNDLDGSRYHYNGPTAALGTLPAKAHTEADTAMSAKRKSYLIPYHCCLGGPVFSSFEELSLTHLRCMARDSDSKAAGSQPCPRYAAKELPYVCGRALRYKS